ncbi:hypothetical protein GCM10022406_07580 [Hymenobacter algoricola]|uniref:Uncharacterized protein n=1 Tax=Hymenobacter algoricola TaxID=486267 RepID=A0ABP7MJS1_9BACT
MKKLPEGLAGRQAGGHVGGPGSEARPPVQMLQLLLRRHGGWTAGKDGGLTADRWKAALALQERRTKQSVL